MRARAEQCVDRYVGAIERVDRFIGREWKGSRHHARCRRTPLRVAPSRTRIARGHRIDDALYRATELGERSKRVAAVVARPCERNDAFRTGCDRS